MSTLVSSSYNSFAGKRRLLVLSILFDTVGFVTYLFPVIGESADIVWAPIAGVLYFTMYRGVLGAAGGLFTFAEEIIPFTDFIPSFTLTWIYIHYFRRYIR